LEVERNVDNPYADCHHYSGLLSVPNGNTGNLNERLIRGDSSIEVLAKTYMRRTIKSEEADIDTKEAS